MKRLSQGEGEGLDIIIYTLVWPHNTRALKPKGDKRGFVAHCCQHGEGGHLKPLHIIFSRITQI